MKFYHAIIVCRRDGHLIPWHLTQAAKALTEIGQGDCVRCLYYGIDPAGRTDGGYESTLAGVPIHVVPFLDIYENLPLKTYGMLQHALTVPGWTHLLKADVNSYPTQLDAETMEKHHLVGYYTRTHAARTTHLDRVYQRGLAETYTGPLPEEWCGGPAYVMSRLLAMKVVQRGVWYARGWPYEDCMVSQVADDCGWPAKPGVGYWTDGKDWRC